MYFSNKFINVIFIGILAELLLIIDAVITTFIFKYKWTKPKKMLTLAFLKGGHSWRFRYIWNSNFSTV